MRKAYTENHFFMAARVAFARKQRRLSQQQLADRAGLGSTRKIAAIENFAYRLDFEQLDRLTQVLKKPRWFFTNPYLLVCEENFRYFLTGRVGKRQLANYEDRMRKYVGIYRFLVNFFNKKDQQRAPKFDFRLPFTVSSPAELAVNAGEKMASILKLGKNPNTQLQTALEKKLGIMTLMLDADTPAIAGASLNLPEGGFICINRDLPPNIRNFTLAHELFHLLTWQALPYDSNSPAKTRLRKVEELATVFASSLLMPRKTGVQLATHGNKQVATALELENAADLGVVAESIQVGIDEQFDAQIPDFAQAPPFAKNYVQLIARGIDEPIMSAMSGTHKLGCETFQEACDLFHTYGVTAPETIEFAMPQYRKQVA